MKLRMRDVLSALPRDAAEAVVMFGDADGAAAHGDISGLTFDSRAVAPGAVFAAVRGASVDGAEYVEQAVAKGASWILTDLRGAVRIRERVGGWPAPVLASPEPRRLAARLAGLLAPGRPETLVAVTGTNGKTSVAHFTAQLLAATGRVAATFGTIGLRSWGLAEELSEPVSHTTLDPIAFHRMLERLAAAGVTHAAIEASSHGLAQHRIDGVALQAAALTNIARDHLDYHLDWADYAAAKLRLFTELLAEDARVVANADDPSFALVQAAAGARGLMAVGRSAEGASALRILNETPEPGGLVLDFSFEGRARRARPPLIGAFQGSNALVAAGLAIAAGAPADGVFAALDGLEGVRGRMELVARRANGAGVFVDYAHTADALATALAALRPHAEGRLHVVFGAGGDRDAGKRPLMGAAAAACADRILVTDDNPRSEDPAAIRAAVLAACPDAVEVGDRAEAILRGVDGLEPGDALLVAGKGHEQGQIVDGEVLPFDDAEQARAAVLALDGEAGRLCGA